MNQSLDASSLESASARSGPLYSALVLAHDALFDGNHTSRHRKRPRVVAAQLAPNFTAEYLSAFPSLRDAYAAMFECVWSGPRDGVRKWQLGGVP